MMRGPFTFPIARAVRSVLLAGTEDELTVELACCRAEHRAVVDVLRQAGWRDISRPPSADVEELLVFAAQESAARWRAEERLPDPEASPVDAIAAFARRELELELAPWQLEVLELLVAGERPNADLVCHVCGAPRSLDQHRCPNEECSDS